MTRAALGALLALTLALDGCGRYGPPERIRKPAEPARSEAKPSKVEELVAKVTPDAVEKLALRSGARVFAILKAHAIRRLA